VYNVDCTCFNGSEDPTSYFNFAFCANVHFSISMYLLTEFRAGLLAEVYLSKLMAEGHVPKYFA